MNILWSKKVVGFVTFGFLKTAFQMKKGTSINECLVYYAPLAHENSYM